MKARRAKVERNRRQGLNPVYAESPCHTLLDVKEGRVVKGVKFVNLRDAGDPIEAGVRL